MTQDMGYTMMTTIKRLLAIGLLSVSLSAAQAASITLSPSTASVGIGGTVDVSFTMDFTDQATLGGGFDLTYDAAVLSLDSWTYAAIGDPMLLGPANTAPGSIIAIAFGDFTGVTGPALVGTASFSAIGAGLADFGMSDNGFPAGPFLDLTTYIPMTVAYNSSALEVTTVPVPAAIWLFGSGLSGLIWMKRRKMDEKTEDNLRHLIS
jgi:hypothetical protein